MSRPTPSPLHYAGSESSAVQLYFTGFHAGDPFIAFGVGRKKYGVFSALEISRARKESSVDEILSLPEWQNRARRYSSNGKAGPAEVIKALARHFKLRRFSVPDDFPSGRPTCRLWETRFSPGPTGWWRPAGASISST
jgi:hypothetical protein